LPDVGADTGSVATLAQTLSQVATEVPPPVSQPADPQDAPPEPQQSPKVYVCKECGQEFPTTWELMRHAKFLHPKKGRF